MALQWDLFKVAVQQYSGSLVRGCNGVYAKVFEEQSFYGQHITCLSLSGQSKNLSVFSVSGSVLEVLKIDFS